MKTHVLIVSLLASAAAFPAFAQERSQGGAVGGAAAGAVGGAVVGGPVGAVVGGAAGAIVGGGLGAMTEPDREYVTTYVRKNRHDSVRIDGDVAVGTVLPQNTRVYRIEGRPNVDKYSYVYINNRPYVVETSSRRIISVIE